MIQNFEGRKFWQIWQITSDLPKFSCLKFFLWLVRNMHELAWITLLKYFHLKSTCKQPIPYPNGELSPSSRISAAKVCVGKLLASNYYKCHHGLVTLIVASGPYANLLPAQKFEKKLLK